jgi:hypothetical protein
MSTKHKELYTKTVRLMEENQQMHEQLGTTISQWRRAEQQLNEHKRNAKASGEQLVHMNAITVHAEQERRRTRGELLQLEERSNFHEQRADSAVDRIASLEEQMRTTQIDVQRMEDQHEAISTEINMKHSSLVDSLR